MNGLLLHLWLLLTVQHSGQGLPSKPAPVVGVLTMISLFIAGVRWGPILGVFLVLLAVWTLIWRFTGMRVLVAYLMVGSAIDVLAIILTVLEQPTTWLIWVELAYLLSFVIKFGEIPKS